MKTKKRGFSYMKKKTLLILLSVCLSCGMLSGCGQKEEATVPAATDVSDAEPEEEEEEEPEPVEEPVEETREGMYRSELTNEWIDEKLVTQRPIAAMVDNEKTALKHYGLTQADVVYEMMNSTANGHITRFMAIVKDWGNITQFGSIRSVRPTNLQIAPEYNAVVCHDGGPFYIDAFLKNPWIDHFSGTFSRVNNGKSREFTEYILSGDLEKNFKNSGCDTQYNEYYQGPHFKFASDTSPTDLSTYADSIDCTLVDLPFEHNNSQLDYDATSNTYLYSEYGMKHTDPANGDKQLAFTNVILQNTRYQQYDSNGYMSFYVIDKGRTGYYITGGKAIPITWQKTNDMEPTRYYDSAGNEILLNTGKTYISLVGDDQWKNLVVE